MNWFVLMPMPWMTSTGGSAQTCFASPHLVVLVVIAMRHGRDQIWPISRCTYRLGSFGTRVEVVQKSARYLSRLFPWVTPEILRHDLQLEGSPSGVGAICTHVICIWQKTALLEKYGWRDFSDCLVVFQGVWYGELLVCRFSAICAQQFCTPLSSQIFQWDNLYYS